MASTYLTRAFSSSTATTKATWSFWVKFSAVNTGVGGTGSMLFQARNSSSSNNYRTYIRYEENGTLDFICYNSSGTKIGEYYTSQKFRDCNAWYHICYSMDTTLNTASDRLKLYVNGVRVTNFYTGSYTAIGQNETVNTTSSVFTDISRNGGSAGYYFNGILSHYILTDGYVYQADTFGSTDSTTGEWKINTSPTISNWGSNGFWILKDGNSVTDSSPNSNTFTVGGGTLTKTEDSPSNVFATMNALSKGSDAVLSKGNTVLGNSQNTNSNVLGTIALGNGKYYWETYKQGAGSTGLGLTLASVDGSNHAAIHSHRVNYFGDGYIYQNGFGLSDINTGVTYADGDIIGVSVDTENGTIKFYKNSVLVNNSSQTNSAFTYTQNELIPFWYMNGGGEWRTNFGNGYFGTTAISSAGTNASNNGIFEYDVPSGYTALSTKGLNL